MSPGQHVAQYDKLMTKICEDCGCEFEWVNSPKRFCPECIRRRKIETKRRLRADGRMNEWDICPSCGGVKSIKAKRCKKCYLQLAAQRLANRAIGRILRRKRKGNSLYCYWDIRKPEHPRATKAGYIREHILVWEEAHEMLLPKGCIVHHLNGDPLDNRSENLVAVRKEKHENRTLMKLWQKRIRELEAENVRLRQMRLLLDGVQSGG